ncbi:EF-hand domain-containing protein [Telluria aromaticivorans]|uniref:EF-hand domain-containing protein n=1 Tax=Telluria aromaticivorans TaxID=2725995 RepID=A0A7Y2NZG4_9BURK|nr:EF-hand domain-containing protein [Telluria aromaticivorans]NNG23862.1 EF-hand domain-containing protein [Telluria aromaticivorans]
MKTMYLFLILVGTAAAAAAQAPIGVDGTVPPALRTRPAEAPAATGAALSAQALAKLEKQFRAADVDGNGSLSVDEAKNFGFVARHFDEIDTGRRGAVSFDDLRNYLVRAKGDRR